MKAITVCQPYASAIIHGPKRIENRRQNWRFRGRLLIHAGKSRKFMGTLTPAEMDEWPEYDEHNLVWGALIGSVEVYDCLHVASLPAPNAWACGPYCLLLRNPVAFRQPIPYLGALGLFDVTMPLNGPSYTASKNPPALFE